MTYLLKRVGFFNKISVSNNPPNDCPIMVLESFVLYSDSFNDVNSQLIEVEDIP